MTQTSSSIHPYRIGGPINSAKYTTWLRILISQLRTALFLTLDLSILHRDSPRLLVAESKAMSSHPSQPSKLGTYYSGNYVLIYEREYKPTLMGSVLRTFLSFVRGNSAIPFFSSILFIAIHSSLMQNQRRPVSSIRALLGPLCESSNFLFPRSLNRETSYLIGVAVASLTLAKPRTSI